MVQLMTQLVELQKDNMDLRRELLRSRTDTPHVKSLERPSIGLDITKGQYLLISKICYEQRAQLMLTGYYSN